MVTKQAQTTESRVAARETEVLTLSPGSRLATPNPEPYSPVEAMEAVESKDFSATNQTDAQAPEPTHKLAFLAVIAKPLVAFSDWLSGPPMTARDRLVQLGVNKPAVHATSTFPW